MGGSRGIFAGLLLLAFGAPVLSQTASSISIGDMRFDFADPALAPRDEAQKSFVDAFRKAKASRDPAIMAALVHPASRACMTSSVGKAYFDERMQRDVASMLPGDARIIFVMRDGNATAFDQLAARGDLTALPVVPTEMVGIDFTREERDAKGVLTRHVGSTIVRQLARHEGRLMLVEYCLTAKGEAKFTDKSRAAQPSKP